MLLQFRIARDKAWCPCGLWAYPPNPQISSNQLILSQYPLCLKFILEPFFFFLKLYLFFLKLFFECQCCFFINALLICFDALSCFLCCVFGIQHRHRGWGCSTAGWSEAKFARRAELPQRVLFHGLSGGLLLLDSLGPWPIVSLETLLDALF